MRTFGYCPNLCHTNLYFHVSPEGGTFVFQGTNYSDFWIISITEQEAKGEEKKFTPPYDDQKHFTITSNWATATQNGNTLTVTISPTTSDANRFIKVPVQSGDAFDEFKFKLRGLKHSILYFLRMPNQHLFFSFPYCTPPNIFAIKKQRYARRHHQHLHRF